MTQAEDENSKGNRVAGPEEIVAQVVHCTMLSYDSFTIMGTQSIVFLPIPKMQSIGGHKVQK